MTFYISPIVAQAESPFEALDHCFCCGEGLSKVQDGSVVAYDAWPTQVSHKSVLMHRDCAFAMAQRIICDAWPNRRVGDVLMKNDR
jgi:hypothetical protein